MIKGDLLDSLAVRGALSARRWEGADAYQRFIMTAGLRTDWLFETAADVEFWKEGMNWLQFSTQGEDEEQRGEEGSVLTCCCKTRTKVCYPGGRPAPPLRRCKSRSLSSWQRA